MKIGLFLDVDGVLTEEPVNMQIAAKLGVAEELSKLEDAFARSEIDNTGFNKEFIPLFRRAGFNESWMRDNFDSIFMRVNYEELLRRGDVVYLVSSGPNYYLDLLAEHVGLPKENVLCSEYDFDADGFLSRCRRPVTGNMKGVFVRERTRKYDVSVGVGDTVPHDTSFLSHCQIKILMGNQVSLEYMQAREIQPIIDTIAALRASGKSRSGTADAEDQVDVAKFSKFAPGERNVFIIIPFRDEDARYRELVRALKEELATHGFKGWLASDLQVNLELWRNVRAFMLGCDYGIAVFTPVEEAGEFANRVYNPNIAAEMGFMLARGKSTLLLKEQGLERLFTDFGGFIGEDFDLSNAEETVRPIVKRWVKGLGA